MIALALLAGLVLPSYAFEPLCDANEIALWLSLVCLFAPRHWQLVALRLLLWLNLAMWRWDTAWDVPFDAALFSGLVLLLALFRGREEVPLQRLLRRLAAPLLGLLAFGFVTESPELLVIPWVAAPVFLFLGANAVFRPWQARVARRWEEIWAETAVRMREIRAVHRLQMRAIWRPADTAARIRELYLR